MKIYEIKIGKKSGEKTFWKTIGTVFCDDESKLFGSNGKPATFTIDYPACNGIIVKREAKKDAANTNIPDNDDSASGNDSDDIPI
jgi:hypothetical protein